MRSYSWLKGTKSIQQLIWFHFTSFSKAFGFCSSAGSDSRKKVTLSGWCPIPGPPCSESPCKLKGFGALQRLGVRGHVCIQNPSVPKHGTLAPHQEGGKQLLTLMPLAGSHNFCLSLAMDSHTP